MKFEYSHYAFIFLVLPIVLFVMWVGRNTRRKRQFKFVSSDIFHKLTPTLSFTRRFWKKVLLLLALVCLILSVLRPQYGVTFEVSERKGINMLIAIDVSSSMKAQDVKPSRLEHAKREVLGLIDNLKGDRIGLVAFSGEAFVQCPLTSDYAAATLFLNDIDTGIISTPGTDIATAIKVSRLAFSKQLTRATDVLVILSDGESFENDPIESARVAAEQGVIIYTVGIGTPAGEPIPLLDEFGRKDGFKKDRQGQVVVSRLNESVLRKIADVTKGKYFYSSNLKFVMDDIYKEVSRLEKTAMEEQLKRSFIDRYRWFLFPAFILLLIEFLISERRNTMPEWRGRL